MGSVKTTSVDIARVKSILPDWFKPETGFRFMFDGDEAVVIGFGAWRNYDNTGEITILKDGKREMHFLYDLVMKPVTLVYAFKYKGEWHMNSVEETIANDEQPFPFQPVKEG